MTHIDLHNELPGIVGLMQFRPETAAPLNLLAETLLRGDSSLSRQERELIAAYVSRLNQCHFCATSHGAFSALQHEDGWDEGWRVVDAAVLDPTTAPVSDKLRALLAIAGRVQQGGRSVDEASIRAARDAGASDVEIHDAVLIAAAFCMFNRYVDGLATFAPPSREDYRETAEAVVVHGYTRF